MIKNLTPHLVTVTGTALPPSGQIARCNEVSTPAGEVDGLPVVRKTYGSVDGLPAAENGTWLIVSAMVRLALPDRSDLLSPGDLIRDAAGNITGCKNLVRS